MPSTPILEAVRSREHRLTDIEEPWPEVADETIR